MRELERYIVLQVVDMRWREHLENMEVLREGVHLRQMAQKDPLVEYTGEGERMFTELGRIIRSEVPIGAGILSQEHHRATMRAKTASIESMRRCTAISASMTASTFPSMRARASSRICSGVTSSVAISIVAGSPETLVANSSHVRIGIPRIALRSSPKSLTDWRPSRFMASDVATAVPNNRGGVSGVTLKV